MPTRLCLLSALCLSLLSTAGLAHADDTWPRFRGPSGAGLTVDADLPLRWSETENVAWKTAIHGRGWSSPVARDGHLWLTTATEDGHEMSVLRVDAATGRIERDLKVYDIAKPEEIHAFNSYASPTPVVEPDRIYLHFGSYGTRCMDPELEEVFWERRDFPCDHYRGPGSSPLVFEDLLILTFDGIDVQYLVAVDKTTGETVWKTDRTTDFGDMVGDQRKAYTTPIVHWVDDVPQLISPGAHAAFAYDARTGEELWTVRYKGFSNAVHPLVTDRHVLINTGFSRAQLWAVRPNGRGDVTETHVDWAVTQSVPNKPAPILVGGHLFMCDDKGIASCLDPVDGRTLWRERISGAFSASPIAAAGRVYFFDEDGQTTVIAAAPEFQVLAQNRLDAGCMGSPAVIGDALLLRTKTHLYRIESSASGAASPGLDTTP